MEDPVRLLRVLRHAARTGFRIEERCYSALLESADLILTASAVRVYDELKKDMLSASFAPFLDLMRSTGILSKLMPHTEQVGAEWLFYQRFFSECDRRVAAEEFREELVMLAGLVIYSLFGSSDLRGNLLKLAANLRSKEEISQVIGEAVGNLFITRRAKDEIVDLIHFVKDALQGIERDQSLKGLKSRKIANLARDFFSVLAVAGGDYFAETFLRLKRDCQWR
jgi:poly(A) polymerase